MASSELSLKSMYEISYRFTFNEPFMPVDSFDNVLVPEFVYFITKYSAEVQAKNDAAENKRNEQRNRINNMRTYNNPINF